MAQVPEGFDPSLPECGSDEPCPCEACVNAALEDVPEGAIFIGTFGDENDFVSFIDTVLTCKVADDAEVLPTGEPADVDTLELIDIWLRKDVLYHTGYFEYFWLSAPHAAFWGVTTETL